MPELLKKRILDAQEHMRDTVTAHCLAGRCDYAKRAICGYQELVDALSEKLELQKMKDDYLKEKEEYEAKIFTIRKK